MKIITEPKVTIVGATDFIPHPDYEIPSGNYSPAVKLCSFAAKGCYDSFGHGGRCCDENQHSILEHKHGSVLEHYHVSFFIEGITRGLSLELNRHRTFNISQRSTRYTAEEDAAFVLEPYFSYLFNKFSGKVDTLSNVGYKFTVPKEEEHLWEAMEELSLLRDHISALYMSQREYTVQVKKLMDLNPNNLTGFELRKWARGKARNVLPHALETRGTWTNNLRGWRWFIESRSDRHAEPEIRVLADKILDELKLKSSLHFKDFECTGNFDRIPEWKPRYSKV